MRAKLWAVTLVGLALGGCGTPGFDSRQLTVRSPIGNVGDRAGTTVGGDSKIRPGDTITLDLRLLIASQLGQSSQPSIEQQIASFDNWTAVDRSQEDATKVRARNSIVESIVWASDANCAVYVQYLRGNQMLSQSVSASLATIFSAASTGFAPKATKSALSALASISSGVGANIDSAVFAKQTLDVVAGAIEADRSEFRANTLEPDLKKTYADLNLAAALSDAQAYHNKCDAVYGLHYLQLQTSNTTTAAKPSAKKPTDNSSEGAAQAPAQVAGQAQPSGQVQPSGQAQSAATNPTGRAPVTTSKPAPKS